MTEVMPPLPAHLFGSAVPSGWESEIEPFVSGWKELPKTTRDMFFGVAMGWWEWVDVNRHAPIPFPKVFNLRNAPANWTMAHVLAHLKIFPSVSEARKNGWSKPIATGELWLFKRTVRVLIVWLDEENDGDGSIGKVY